MKKNQIKRFFCGIIAVAILIIFEILSLAGLNIFALFDKIPFLIGVAIIILIIGHFVPEKVYEYYEDNPCIFYAIYFFECVFVIILAIFCHHKYFS